MGTSLEVFKHHQVISFGKRKKKPIILNYQFILKYQCMYGIDKTTKWLFSFFFLFLFFC